MPWICCAEFIHILNLALHKIVFSLCHMFRYVDFFIFSTVVTKDEQLSWKIQVKTVFGSILSIQTFGSPPLYSHLEKSYIIKSSPKHTCNTTNNVSDVCLFSLVFTQFTCILPTRCLRNAYLVTLHRTSVNFPL